MNHKKIGLIMLSVVGSISCCIVAIFWGIVLMILKKNRKRYKGNETNLAMAAMDQHDNANLLSNASDHTANITENTNQTGARLRCSISWTMSDITCTPNANHIKSHKGNMVETGADGNAQNEDHAKINAWLQNVVELPEYSKAFVEAGYDSLELINQIKNMEKLNEIGIASEQHCNIILKAIQKLKFEFGSTESLVDGNEDNMLNIAVCNDMEIRESIESQISIPTGNKMKITRKPTNNLEIFDIEALMDDDEIAITGDNTFEETMGGDVNMVDIMINTNRGHEVKE